jgi:predicted nucleotidyltransferase
MLTRETIITRLREHYPYLAAEYGVKRIGLFGSYASGTPNEASDVDVVVEFQQSIGFKFVEFAEYLEALLEKKVDILTPAGIQGIRVGRVAQNIMEGIVYV